MKSELIIAPIEKLEKKKIEIVKNNKKPGIYVSLNKSVRGLKKLFDKNKIKYDKIFFIDCVSSKKENPETLIIFPDQINNLEYAIKTFIDEIKGEKILIIDALSTLLIYNRENEVAKFIKEIINYPNGNQTEIIALTPKIKGEELLNKIFDFFDRVEGK